MGVLIICMGNEERGDDGAGLEVARNLKGRLPAGVRLLVPGPLDVTLAEELQDASRVIFVDADQRLRDPCEVRAVVDASDAIDAHALSPEALLATARALYDARPAATLVCVRASETGHGRGLTPQARAAANEATEAVLRLL
ncbi:MAG TPA: hydrogenase maturation protease [Coriobacteriia bacterium]